MIIRYMIIYHCQAQLQLQLKLKLALFSDILTTHHPPTQPGKYISSSLINENGNTKVQIIIPNQIITAVKGRGGGSQTKLILLMQRWGQKLWNSLESEKFGLLFISVFNFKEFKFQYLDHQLLPSLNITSIIVYSFFSCVSSSRIWKFTNIRTQ